MAGHYFLASVVECRTIPQLNLIKYVFHTAMIHKRNLKKNFDCNYFWFMFVGDNGLAMN